MQNDEGFSSVLNERLKPLIADRARALAQGIVDGLDYDAIADAVLEHNLEGAPAALALTMEVNRCLVEDILGDSQAFSLPEGCEY